MKTDLIKLHELLNAKFVAFAMDDGNIISIVPDKMPDELLSKIKILIKSTIRTSELLKHSVVEVLCSSLTERIALCPAKANSEFGYLVVGMKEEFDVLAMKGVLNSLTYIEE